MKHNAIDKDEMMLGTIIEAMGIEALTAKINGPIDSVRASFESDSATVKSLQEFTEIVRSFFIHLLESIGQYCEGSDPAFIEAEALDLVDRAFSENNSVCGLRAALSEAMHGINGRMRCVLDRMTDQFERDCQKKEVERVLKSSLDPLDWPVKVRIMAELLKRMEHHLPQEIISQPPERFSRHYELIISSYVQSVNEARILFR
jgi:hypothetical protein